MATRPKKYPRKNKNNANHLFSQYTWSNQIPTAKNERCYEEIPGFKNVWNGETKEREKLQSENSNECTPWLHKFEVFKFNSLQLNTYRVSKTKIFHSRGSTRRSAVQRSERERENHNTTREEEGRRKEEEKKCV